MEREQKLRLGLWLAENKCEDQASESEHERRWNILTIVGV